MGNQIKFLKQAVFKARTQTALARTIGVSPCQVNQWVLGNRPIPYPHCLSIEEHYGIDKMLLVSARDADLINSFK